MPKKIACPDCKEEVEIMENSEVGEIVECLNCGSEMEIINLDPLEVSLIEEEK